MNSRWGLCVPLVLSAGACELPGDPILLDASTDRGVVDADADDGSTGSDADDGQSVVDSSGSLARDHVLERQGGGTDTALIPEDVDAPFAPDGGPSEADTTAVNPERAEAGGACDGGVSSFEPLLAVGGNFNDPAPSPAHSCVLMAPDDLRCWGSNTRGELGLGADAFANFPSPQRVAIGPLRAITAGIAHTCVITAPNNGVRCWGANDSQQAGQPRDVAVVATVLAPPAADVLENVEAIAAGDDFTCALMADTGGVRCWGANDYGQLGTGNAFGPDMFSLPPSSDAFRGIDSLAAGWRHVCAVTTDKRVVCWGSNGYGELGDGSRTTRGSPPSTGSVLGDVPAMMVTAGVGHSCAVTTAGGVRCWGDNSYGQLGDPTIALGDWRPRPTGDVVTDAQAVVAGALFTCSLTKQGAVLCWGNNAYGQLGTGFAPGPTLPQPVEIMPQPVQLGTAAKSIQAGGTHACAVTVDNHVLCWGSNESGELGNGSTSPSNALPKAVAGLATPCR
jgi:alpha-tubulin suppressor-like RCC1 family protein